LAWLRGGEEPETKRLEVFKKNIEGITRAEASHASARDGTCGQIGLSGESEKVGS